MGSHDPTVLSGPTEGKLVVGKMAAPAHAEITWSLLTWASGGECPARSLRFASVDVGSVGSRREQLIEAVRVGLSEDATREETAQAWRSYALSLGAIVIPGLAVAACVLACCLPLWVGRCRAHRCCAPGQDGPSRRTRFLANTGFPLFGLIALAGCAIGLLAVSDLGAAVAQTACRLATVLEHATAVVDAANVSLTRIVDRSYNVDEMATPFESSLNALQGSSTEACAAISSAANAVDQLAADLAAAGQSAGAVQAVAASLLDTCGDSVAVAVAGMTTQADAAADKMREVVQQARELVRALVDFVRDAQAHLRRVDETAGEYTNLVIPLDPKATNNWPDMYRNGFALGLLLFLSPLALLPVALCTAPAMASSGDKRRYCCAAFGVQWVGASWVICGLAAVAYLVLGAAVLGGAAALQDAGAVARSMPDGFLPLFDGTRVCTALPLVAAPPDLHFDLSKLEDLTAHIAAPASPAVSSAPPAAPLAESSAGPVGRRLREAGLSHRRAQTSVPGCDLVSVALSACWTGAPLVDALLARLGLPWTLGTVHAQLDGLEAALWRAELAAGINGSAFEAAADGLRAAVLDATPTDFGLDCPVEDEGYAEWCTASVLSAEGAAPAGCTLVCDCAMAEKVCSSVRESIRKLQVHVATVQEQVGILVRHSSAVDAGSAALGAELVGLLRAAVDTVEGSAQCGWLPDDTDQLIGAASGIASTTYVLSAFALLMAGVALCAYVPAAIAVQIVYGGVGYEPGCPAACRSRACCGWPAAKPRSARAHLGVRTPVRAPTIAQAYMTTDGFEIKDTFQASV